MDEEPVREAGEAGERVVVVGGQRLVREVAGGEDQRPADGLEQQVVERRVRQEHAEAPVARRDRRGQARAARPRRASSSTIGRAGAVEEPPLQRPDPAQRRGRPRGRGP